MLIFLGYACGRKVDKQVPDEIEMDVVLDSSTVEFEPQKYNNQEIIFYNLFSPVEFTYLVKEKSAYYNSLLINPINNITRYNSSAKYALNLGIYGADLSYLWMFKQSQQALSYRAAIQHLSDQLEIPADFVNLTYETAEPHAQDFDSLVFLAKQSYQIADNYLKQSGRPKAASLILLGGWIETMYIATNMYDKPDNALLNRIALQSYSLNSVYSLLQKYQADIEIREYSLMLKKLKKVYESNQIALTPEVLMVDTLAKHIKLRSNQETPMTFEAFKEIQMVTSQIRNNIIQ